MRHFDILYIFLDEFGNSYAYDIIFEAIYAPACRNIYTADADTMMFAIRAVDDSRAGH